MKEHQRAFKSFAIKVLWSTEITQLIDEIEKVKGGSYATHHDIVLKGINALMFGGEGTFDKRFRVQGQKYFDLKIPMVKEVKTFEYVEFKLRTDRLKFLREELKQREDVFSRNDYLYFSYFIWRTPKDPSVTLNGLICIFYLVIIIFTKECVKIELDELIAMVEKEEARVIKEVAELSEVDPDKESFEGMKNMIKIEIQRKKLLEKDQQLKEKDQQLKEKDQQLKEKDRIIKEMKEQLKEKKRK